MVVRAEEKATLDLNEGVEGGTDYSGILAGERPSTAAYSQTILHFPATALSSDLLMLFTAHCPALMSCTCTSAPISQHVVHSNLSSPTNQGPACMLSWPSRP